MAYPLTYLWLSAALTVAGCQSASSPDHEPTDPVETAPTAPASSEAKTADEARALTANYLETQPHPELYVVDSARVNDNGATWQVLVPRRDWAKRMPNSARFEVNKATGAVSTGLVK